MIKNYIKIAWRNLSRNKGFSIINIGGLALALAVFIIIMLFIRHENNYDTFYSDSDQLYRLLLDTGHEVSDNLPEVVGRQLEELYPEVAGVTKVSGPFHNRLANNEKFFYTEHHLSTSPNFFQLFDFQFIAGNPRSALSTPESAVISESLARKLFGKIDILGERIEEGVRHTLTITGVITDPPSNTHFELGLVTLRQGSDTDSWNRRSAKTYLKLAPNTDAELFREKLAEYVDEYKPDQGVGDLQLLLQPVTDIHLYPQGRAAGSSGIIYIRVLFVVAVLILLVACINYINLATSKSGERMREVGVRKTMGASRGQVMMQLAAESVLVCLIAFIAALLLVELTRPLVQDYFNLHLMSLFSFSMEWVSMLIGTVVGVGLVSGVYVAVYLSRFRPAEVLKQSGTTGTGKRSSWIRQVLVVAQFTISIAIIIASIIITQQMEFIRMERLDGHDEQVLVINNRSPEMHKKFEAFKQKLLGHSAIISVSAGNIPNQTSGRHIQGNTTTHYLTVEEGYINTLGLHLLSGRPFEPRDSTNAVIINNSAAKKFGVEVANQQQVDGDTPVVGGKKVIGIVEDFHALTLFDPITPVVLQLPHPKYVRRANILVRFAEGRISAGMEHVQTTWNRFEPMFPLSYTFLDEVLDQDYRAELRMSKIFNAFSGFSIFIACLGLLGLAAYTAQRRTKEIGIRKVMGASVQQIVGLLSKDFLKLVALGFLLAVPIAWYAMHRWLQDFAYRIEIGPGVFLLAGGVALLIALATVSWQSIRAAVANPVDSLRSE